MGQQRGPLHRLAKWVWMRLFPIAERLGIHLYPVHYYSQLPDTRDLRRRYEQWYRRSDLPGLAMDVERQLELLEQLTAPYGEEMARLPRYEEETQRFGTGECGEIEALTYYCFIRQFRPKRIVDVGSGVSAAIALRAVEANEDDVEITCINPYPAGGLEQLARDGRITLIAKMAQEADMECFSQLAENDILFIDSTHTVKLGGDVNHLVLEVLPRLAPGVLVQFHDIPWPMPCFKPLEDLVFGQEAALVQAFLDFNSDFEILLCQWLLQMDHPDALGRAFPVYDRALHRPSSLWIRRTPTATS